MLDREPAVNSLTEKYDRYLVPGGPPLGDPAPVPHGPEKEEPIQHNPAQDAPPTPYVPVMGDVVFLEEAGAHIDGMPIQLTEEDVKAIRTIVAARAAALFEEQLKAFKEKHALLKKR